MSKEKQTLHIYIRVSTGGQEKDGTSLDSQLKLGKQKAKSLGMDYEVHDERSASSSKDDLEKVKASIPPSKWNAQYQQRPTGEENAIIPREW